jgi:hypothetical protein
MYNDAATGQLRRAILAVEALEQALEGEPYEHRSSFRPGG